MNGDPSHKMTLALQPLADALTKASTVEGVADALVENGLPILNACVLVLAILSEDGTEFYCLRVAGYSEEVADRWRRFPANAHVPIAEAVRQNRLILLESLEKRIAFYHPDLELPERVGRAIAAVPIKAGEVIGGLGFAFPDDRTFGADEQRFLIAVASLCAQALGKVRRTGVGCEVLLVEDNPAVRDMLNIALRFHAFAVRSVFGGEAAVRTYERHQHTIDIVLVDVQMPGIDGPQTLAALQAIDPDVRCVFMSGNTGAYTSEELLKRGAVGVLPKPFASLHDVMRVLREAVRR